MERRKQLRARLEGAARDSEVWSPRFFRLREEADEEAMCRLLDEIPGIRVCDVIEEQIADLIKSRSPGERFSDAQLRELVRRHLGDVPPEEYGVWVYYGWSRSLVHLLDEAEFVELRTNRNKYKLTPAEQAHLATRRVGVVGLSVGQAVATTLALERSAGEIRLADFDRLDLSNLNRIRSSVNNLGTSKVLMTAREIAEIDPFLKVDLFPVGIHDANINAFLLKNGKLDVLIDECDSIDIKIRLRICAKMHRIPVVMETSDRGMIDIERFDKEPGRPIFHGLVGNIDPERLANLTTEEKVPYVLKIIGARTMSKRMIGSLMEVDSTIKTWPQLGSAVVYGGGACADVVRRVSLGTINHSGRYYVDVEEIVPDSPAGSSEATDAAPRPEPPSPRSMRAAAVRVGSGRREDERPLSDDEVRALVSAAALAPSGGNVQPWSWLAQRGRLLLFHDRSRSEGLTNFRNSGGLVGLGAALENVRLAAHARGLAVSFDHFPVPDDPDLVTVVRGLSRPGPEAEPRGWEHLGAVMAERHTNRRLVARRPLARDVVEELRAAVRSVPGGDLLLVEDNEGLAEAGRFIGINDRLRLMNDTLNREMFREIRWTDAEADETRDGLHVDTLEMTASDRAGMEICLRRDALAFVRSLGGGRGLEKAAVKAVAGASAVGLITMSSAEPLDYLRGGVAMQRLWLAANARGVALQPMSTLPYFFARVVRGGGVGLDEATIQELVALRPRYLRLFPVRDDQAEVLLFRLTLAEPPVLRSLRRRLDEILLIDDAVPPAEA